MNSAKKKNAVYFVVFIAFTLITFVRLFYKLGSEALNATDEAWYATNTCEMFLNKNWLVPTLRGEIDYGSKPPLSLFLNLLCYSVFGISDFSFRFSSALSGLLIFILITAFLYKKYDIRYAVMAACAFPLLQSCFSFHMFRAGDMDALFCLFYILAIYALYEMKNNNPKMVILFGFALGQAFITKSMHAVLIFLVGVLFIPFIYKNLRVRYVLISVATAIIPTLLWIIARYPVDGIKFVYSITMGETKDKVDAAFTWEYLYHIVREPVTILMFGILVIRILLYFIRKGKVLSGKTVILDLRSFLMDRYLTIVSYLLPILMYSFAGSFLEWYIYPAYIVSVWIVAIEAGTILDRLEGTVIEKILPAVIILGCAFYACFQISEYKTLGHSGYALEEFREDIRSFREQNPDKYLGANAYCAYDRHRLYGDTDHWENSYTFYAESLGNLWCKDGGVEGFLADENSVIILDSELWDTYAQDLTGYVFLEQNTFYVLCHERY